MILVAGLVLIVASVPLTGGRLRHVVSLRLRSGWLVGAALLLQTLVVSVLPTGVPRPLAEAIHLGTYGMAIAFLWRNRHIPWLWLVATGGGLNLAAIAANHGVMPASRAALRVAGMAEKAGFANSAVVHHARLAFLGDVFPIPRGVPLANVFSVGDVVLLVGAALLLHRVARPRVAAVARVDTRLSPGAVAEVDDHADGTVVRLETGSSLHRVADGSRLELHLRGGVVTCEGGTVASMTDNHSASAVVVIRGSARVETAAGAAVLHAHDALFVSFDGRIRDQIHATASELESDPWLAANAITERDAVLISA